MRDLLLTLLDTPAAWCQGALARNPAKVPVPMKSPEGVSWCIVAAVRICQPDPDIGHANIIKLGNKAKELYGSITLTDFNNAKGRTYEEVRTLIEATYPPVTGTESGAGPDLPADSGAGQDQSV